MHDIFEDSISHNIKLLTRLKADTQTGQNLDAPKFNFGGQKRW